MPSTLCSVTQLLQVAPHHLKRRLQLLLELCRLLFLPGGNSPGTPSCLGCTRRRSPQISCTCCPSCSRAPPLGFPLLVLFLFACSGCAPLPTAAPLPPPRQPCAAPPHALHVAAQPPPPPVCPLPHQPPPTLPSSSRWTSPSRARRQRRRRCGQRPEEARQPPELLEPGPRPRHHRRARWRRPLTKLRASPSWSRRSRLEEDDVGSLTHRPCTSLLRTGTSPCRRPALSASSRTLLELCFSPHASLLLHAGGPTLPARLEQTIVGEPRRRSSA
jgi:hypothetical protein